MMSYLALKTIHVGSVALSLTLFITRGIWMLADSPRLQRPWARRLPHVIDTVLLASAIALAITIHQYPLVHPWLTAKFFGLLAYIGLGSVALKRGRTKGIRAAAFVAALTVFAYIVSVAVTHHPFPPAVL